MDHVPVKSWIASMSGWRR
jgi:hypothetical protein